MYLTFIKLHSCIIRRDTSRFFLSWHLCCDFCGKSLPKKSTLSHTLADFLLSCTCLACCLSLLLADKSCLPGHDKIPWILEMREVSDLVKHCLPQLRTFSLSSHTFTFRILDIAWPCVEKLKTPKVQKNSELCINQNNGTTDPAQALVAFYKYTKYTDGNNKIMININDSIKININIKYQY